MQTTTTTMLNESHHEDDNSAHRDGKARNDTKIDKKKSMKRHRRERSSEMKLRLSEHFTDTGNNNLDDNTKL